MLSKEQFNKWFSLQGWRPFFLIFVLGFLLYSQTLIFNLTCRLESNATLLARSANNVKLDFYDKL